MSQWVRLWEDMPNDPKWRVVARRAGRPVSEVLAVFVHMMTNAGSSSERGKLESWSDEDVAIAIDAEVEHVSAIRDAMQTKTLDGDSLKGWDKRQPKREDGSSERGKAWREANKTRSNEKPDGQTPIERTRTHANASEPPEERREEENRKKDDASRAQSVEAKLRIAITDAFVAARSTTLNPETGRAAVWLAQGYDPVICITVVRDILGRNANPKNLSYFDRAIAEAHDKRASPSQIDQAEPRIDFGGGVTWPEKSVKAQVDHWRRDPSTWPRDRLGPPPGERGCRLPAGMLEAA